MQLQHWAEPSGSRAGALFCPHGDIQTHEVYECTDRTGVSAPRKGGSEEAALYPLEVQSSGERRRLPKSLGLPRVFLALLWYFGELPKR